MKLDGVRVLDLSLLLPGPHLTQTMCDHGAEVISIEPPGGEPARAFGPVKNGHTPWFRSTHRGKKSLCLNLKLPEARAVLMRLVARADVFVEAFRPGVAARLGIDYAAVSAVNPRIVYCSITAFGQSGPLRDRPAHDLSIQALAGVANLNRGTNGEPALPGMPAADMCASLTALSGILMALYRRTVTGRGDYIDISMHDATLGWTQNVVGPIFAEGRAHDIPNERGWGGRAFYNVYRTADGRYLTLSGNEHKFVESLLHGLGRPDLVALGLSAPGPQQAPLTAFLREAFGRETLEHWRHWFRDKDLCWGEVLDLKEAFAHEQAVARGMISADGEGNPHIGLPVRYAAEPGRADFRVPALNADAASVLRDAGLSDGEIAALRVSGAVPG
ncbi:MAG: CoA transferase [Gammaproteobacteria bacterium]|nr:CoA transferase [Gammaproteobacteria bacterium]